jgi:rubrerythrin
LDGLLTRYAQEFSVEDYFDTDETLLDQQHNRLRKEQLKEVTIEGDTKALATIEKKKVKAYEELAKRYQREKVVHSIKEKLEKQRAHITVRNRYDYFYY